LVGRENEGNSCYSSLVWLSESTFIDKGVSEIILRGKVSVDNFCNFNLDSSDSYVFSPNSYSVKNGIYLSNCLISPKQLDDIPIRGIKDKDETFNLKKGTILGKIELISRTSHNRSLFLSKENKNMTSIDLIKFHTSNKFNRSTHENNLLSNLLLKYKTIFSRNKMDLGKTNIVQHKILTNCNNPITQPLRKIPLAIEPKVDELIEELKNNKIIQESSSPWSSPIVAVQKPNGQIRMCIDYRKLNSVTDRPIFPIPDATQLFDTLGSAQYFSTIDLSQGYYQIEMDKEDIEKTAFTTRQGHFEFLRMPFGLSGAPSTFQRMMHLILKGLNWKSCLIYLDDVLIFGRNLEEHNTRLMEVLECFQKSGLKLSPEKCQFLLKEVSYLGHTISSSGIKTDSSKVSKIKDFPVPCYEANLVSFLGFCGYYRKFIKNYADVVAPLESICKKGTRNSKICWNENALVSFEKLKDLLTSAPILAFPIPKGKYILDTDASDSACGAVLSQIQNNKERVIAYASHKFSAAERKYCTTRKELLAVHKYTLHFKHYLYGQQFLVRTDHKSLIWFLNWKNPNTSQYCRWRADLETFDMVVQHRAGEQHKNADFLSRIDCEQCEISHPDPKKRRNVKIYQNNSNDIKIRKLLINEKHAYCQSKDKNIKVVIQLMKEKRLNEAYPQELFDYPADASDLWLVRKHLRIRGDCLFYKTDSDAYLLIPPMKKRKEIIITLHKELSHTGIEKMLNELKKNYYWPKMKLDIKIVINSCKNCAFTKLNDTGVTPMQPNVLSYPFQRIGIDIAGPLPTSKEGYRYILGIIDYFSKYPMLIPLRTTESVTIAKGIFKNWITVFGCPYQIHSDNGPNISSSLINSVCQQLGIVKSTSTPYHPKSNGLIERLFRTTKEALRATMFGELKSGWAEKLPGIEMTLRSTVNSTTRFSPYEIIFGQEMRRKCFIECGLEEKKKLYAGGADYFIDLIKDLRIIKHQVKYNTQTKAEKMKVNQKLKKRELNVNSFVMVKLPPAKQSPLGNKYEGPYKIIEVINPYVYKLQGSSGKCIKRHRDHIKPVLISPRNKEFSYSSKSTSHSDPTEDDNQTPDHRQLTRTRRPVQRYGYDC